MKKIINPWCGMEGYNCYGCNPDNKSGLRMEFYEDGDEIVSVWNPRPEFQSWCNTLHGGIQAALADEISGWVIFRKFRTSGMTYKMEVRYHKPISTTEGSIVLRSSAKQQRRNIVDLEVRIYDHAGNLCTEAACTYFTFPREKAYNEFLFRDCDVSEHDEQPL